MSKKFKKVLTKEKKSARDQIITGRRTEYANGFHIIHTGDCYQILQIPADNGEPFFFWPEEFDSATAANLFRDEMIDALASGDWRDAYCFSGNHQFYNVVGKILDIIESHEGDTRALAFRIASSVPSRPKQQTEPKSDLSILS
ncbi:MAG: hypothetical protein KDK28_07160 [Maritimibacter sp.]|nr:hypothetical protein [Maritimibacter sp.]